MVWKGVIYPRLRLQISVRELILGFLWGLGLTVKPQTLAVGHGFKAFSLGEKQVLGVLSVRTAFDLLFQALDLPPGTEVLISAVNVRDMVEIIRQHGLIPVPVKIKLDSLMPDLEQLEALISPRSRVLVVAHLFGTVLDLQAVARLCQQYNVLLVEDCAQAFCGDRYWGSPLADVSLFSFGPIKSCTALGGAIASFRSLEIADRIRRIESQYPRKSELWFCQRVLKYLGLKLLSVPVIYAQLLAILKLLNYDLDATVNTFTRGFKTGDLFAKLRYRPPQTMLKLLDYKLTHLQAEYYQQRQQKARLLIKHLSLKICCPGYQVKLHSFWVFPILVKHPQAVMTDLRSQGFDATQGNTSLTYLESDFRVDFTVTDLQPQHLKQELLYLPLSVNLPDREVIRLAQLINHIVAEIPEP